MKTDLCEFAPLEMEKATELEEMINLAAQENQALLIGRGESGLAGSAPSELIAPSENTNALSRYQRHY